MRTQFNRPLEPRFRPSDTQPPKVVQHCPGPACIQAAPAAGLWRRLACPSDTPTTRTPQRTCATESNVGLGLSLSPVSMSRSTHEHTTCFEPLVRELAGNVQSCNTPISVQLHFECGCFPIRWKRINMLQLGALQYNLKATPGQLLPEASGRPPPTLHIFLPTLRNARVTTSLILRNSCERTNRIQVGSGPVAQSLMEKRVNDCARLTSWVQANMNKRDAGILVVQRNLLEVGGPRSQCPRPPASAKLSVLRKREGRQLRSPPG